MYLPGYSFPAEAPEEQVDELAEMLNQAQSR